MNRKNKTLFQISRHLVRYAIILMALAAGCCLFSCTRTEQRSVVPLEKITIAFPATPDAVVAEVAQAKGYFRQQGLEVTPHMHPYGKLALQEVMEGKADLATVAETPIMLAVMNGAKISILATIQSADNDNAVIARKDHGILTLKHLKGKRIAVTSGTTSDYFLDSLLVLNGMSRKEITVVTMTAEKMPDALANGDIDAVSTFYPYIASAQKKLGDRGITFSDKDVFMHTFNIVATQDFIRNNPEKVKKVLNALIKAEEFISRHTAESQQIVADFIGTDYAMVRDIWADRRFTVSLEQSLILALENESRWAISGGMTGESTVPNYLDFVYLDGLMAVKPKAVRVLR